ncbi:hypothetical protein A3C37_03440 [Candidatus Peribacteria bacterium RIFCSPHIGHO2_02_FULL_53_20]|nr:MAG: hypothetical protein A3C37_03440 [Candidatus Peribacteria bacterium RIFCSPHIGHO2_02_FULL_53_20]
MFHRFLSIATIAATVLAAFPAHARTVDRVNSAYYRQPLYMRLSRRTIRATVRKPVRPPRISSASSSASSVSSAFPASSYDPDSDVSLGGRIALLGDASPVLGSVKVFNNAEPLRIETVTVTLENAVTSVDHLLIYDHDGGLLGSARLDSSVSGGKTYLLNIKTRKLTIPQRSEYSFYVRAQLKNRDAGGVSAELLQIDSIAVAGVGGWSNRTYAQSLTGTFGMHQTARSMITGIINAGAVNEPLLSGSDREIGRFRFIGVRNDGGADLRLAQLTFTLSHVGGVTLSDVQIVADGSSDRASCTISSSTITCPLSASFGSLTSSSRILTLLADVTVPSTAPRASLQLSLNEPGTSSSAGSIQWTDGTTTFDWVGFEGPVARGTYYSY